MDAYNIKNKIAALWQKLCPMPSAATIVKNYESVPVYVSVNNKLIKVIDVIEHESKIILEIEK